MRSKFNVSATPDDRTYDGIVFDSAMEMRYYRDYVLPSVADGNIVKFGLQVPYDLQPRFEHHGKKILAITYVADFVLEYSDGRTEVIDIKGCPDSVALIKRKMFWYHYPELDYKWICYSKIDGGWCEYEYVQQQRKKRKKERLMKKKEQEENGNND